MNKHFFSDFSLGEKITPDSLHWLQFNASYPRV